MTGDITGLSVDAIVNAANESLWGGGDGAIQGAAGLRLLEYNKMPGGCPTGEARITPRFDLGKCRIKYIIHTVGPIWNGRCDANIGDNGEDVLLALCYRQSLILAESKCMATIAFPAISTGVYRFPKDLATRIAVGQTLSCLGHHRLPEKAIFCCFSKADAQICQDVLAEVGHRG